MGAWVVDVEARGHVGWGQDVFQPYVAVDISVDVAVASVLHGVADGGVGQVGYLEPGEQVWSMRPTWMPVRFWMLALSMMFSASGFR